MVAAHDGDGRAYDIEHAGIEASLQPGASSAAFAGQPIAGVLRTTGNKAAFDAPGVDVPDVEVPAATATNNVRQGFHEAAVNLVARHGAEALAKWPELRGYGEG